MTARRSLRAVLIDGYDFEETNNSVIFASVYDTLAFPNLIRGASSKLALLGAGRYLVRDRRRWSGGRIHGRHPVHDDPSRSTSTTSGNASTAKTQRLLPRLRHGSHRRHPPAHPPDSSSASTSPVATDPRRGSTDVQSTLPQWSQLLRLHRHHRPPNIVDLHPCVEMKLVHGARYAEQIDAAAGYHQFWRQSDNDAT